MQQKSHTLPKRVGVKVPMIISLFALIGFGSVVLSSVPLLPAFNERNPNAWQQNNYCAAIGAFPGKECNGGIYCDASCKIKQLFTPIPYTVEGGVKTT